MKLRILSTLNIKRMCKILSVFAVFVVLMAAVQRLLVPKYVGETAEGGLIGEYYEYSGNNDVIFLGDSEVYYNFSPEVLKDEYDINAYVRGSANQTMCQSYYILMDSLRYETPKVVVLSVASLMKDGSDSEAYNRMTIDGMKWTKYKIDCIKDSMLEGESFISYVFPILRYHARWSELSQQDIKYYFGTPSVSDRGYIEKTEVVPMSQLPAVRPLADYDLSDTAMNYMDMIREVCEEKDITLVLVKSPSQYPYWYKEWDEQVVNYAKEYNLTYVNLLNNIEDVGLDFLVDTFDGGLHLNATGAKKNTIYFGKILVEEIGYE